MHHINMRTRRKVATKLSTCCKYMANRPTSMAIKFRLKDERGEFVMHQSAKKDRLVSISPAAALILLSTASLSCKIVIARNIASMANASPKKNRAACYLELKCSNGQLSTCCSLPAYTDVSSNLKRLICMKELNKMMLDNLTKRQEHNILVKSILPLNWFWRDSCAISSKMAD